MRLTEFEYQGRRFALPLACVRRVLPSAAPVPLPAAPDIVLGVLNIGGDIVTVVDLCRRLALPVVPITPAQRLLLIEMAGFQVGLIVDRVFGVSERAVDAASGVPDRLAGGEFVAGLLRLEEGLSLIIDPERFLLDSERVQLDEALNRAMHENE
jgi:chemotaxis signal transduction protein